MKKVIPIFLSLLILLSALTSCSGGSKSSTISLGDKGISLKVGEKKVLTASVGGDAVKDASKLTWSTEDSNTVKVSNKGEVEAVRVGKSVITVISEDKKSKATCTVTVKSANTDITDITIDVANLALEVGEAQKTPYSVKPEDADTTSLIWKSSNPVVATVEDGTVTAIAKGTAVIMVSNKDETISAACILNVSENGASTGTMLLDKNEVNLICGEQITSSSYSLLTPSFSPATLSDSEIVWVSSNESVAKVSSKGVVVAISEGPAVITATSKKYDLSAVCTVNVSKNEVPITSISVYPSTMSLEVGGSNSAAIFVYPTNATNQAVIWSSSNILVATVDASTGTITGISEGYAIITATTADGLKTANCTVNVSGKTGGVSGAITFDKTSIELGNGKQGVLTVNPAGTKVSWKSSNLSVVAVDAAGILTATGVGQATVTATTEDGSSTATCIVNVVAQSSTPSTGHIASTQINLSTNAKTLNVGDTFTLESAVLPTNATYQNIAWSSSDGNVASVDNGKITALSPGMSIITASNGEVSAKCTIMVEKPVTVKISSIELSQGDMTVMEVGKELNISATINPSDYTEGFKWSIDNSAYASINPSGTSCTVTASAVGQITVTITTDSGYSKSCTILIQ